MKYFKTLMLWVLAPLTTLALAALLWRFGPISVAKIVGSSLVGYLYLLGCGFFFSVLGNMSLRKVVWFAAVVHVLTYSVVGEEDVLYFVGPLLGLLICHWLIRASERILSTT